MAGNNIRFDVWRVVQGTDDRVGGAVHTGTWAYTGIEGRFQANPDEQLLLQQGLETQRTFTARIIPGTLVIKERDELMLSEPFDHPYHNQYFRVISMRYSDHNPRDPRNYILLQLVRSVRAHDFQ